MVIELFINNDKALRNITDGNPNDDECRHQIVILFKAVNDAVH